VQQLKERDLISRTNFCREFLTFWDENEGLIHSLFMTDEAHFYLSGFVNEQNFRYWSNVKPRQLHQKPLQSARIRVWCAVSSFGIVGPYFFKDDNEIATTVT
jgi:hypothetical protein